jgi:hypothetical protein
MECDYVTGMAHTLQLIVEDALKSQRVVSDAIAVARRLVGHFNHSTQATDTLRDLQRQLDLPQHSLIQDVQTRWNSTFYLVERLLEQRRPLYLYGCEHKAVTLPTPTAWGLLEKTVDLLRPFEEMTRELSKASACISVVIPAVQLLYNLLGSMPDSGVGSMKDCLLDGLKVRFDNASKNIVLTAATFLDPRYKEKYLADPEATKSAIAAMLSDAATDDIQEMPPPEKMLQLQVQCGIVLCSWMHHNPISMSCSSSQQEPRVPHHSCPLTWWAANHTRFPSLGLLARS